MPNIENNYSSRILFAFINTERFFVIFRTRKCMTHEKMHLHLFHEKCVNQQHRTAEGKKKPQHSVGYFTFTSWEPLSNGSFHSPHPLW